MQVLAELPEIKTSPVGCDTM